MLSATLALPDLEVYLQKWNTRPNPQFGNKTSPQTKLGFLFKN
jgi:hypothetical protein